MCVWRVHPVYVVLCVYLSLSVCVALVRTSTYRNFYDSEVDRMLCVCVCVLVYEGLCCQSLCVVYDVHVEPVRHVVYDYQYLFSTQATVTALLCVCVRACTRMCVSVRTCVCVYVHACVHMHTIHLVQFQCYPHSWQHYLLKNIKVMIHPLVTTTRPSITHKH